MIKLVPAKCPSCGAKLGVNKDLENTICQYCGTTVLIDEAIQKHKVEISGKVKVTKDYSDKIETAKKYLKLDKKEEAQDILFEVLEKDELNLEAMSIVVELSEEYINELNSKTVEELLMETYRRYDKEYGYEIPYYIEYYNNVKKLDEAGEYKVFIDKYNEIINEINDKIKQVKSIIKEKQKLASEILSKCNKYVYSKNGDEKRYKAVYKIINLFKVNFFSTPSTGIGDYAQDGWKFNLRYSKTVFHYIDENWLEIGGESYHSASQWSYKSNAPMSLEEKNRLIDDLIEKDSRGLLGRIFK